VQASIEGFEARLMAGWEESADVKESMMLLLAEHAAGGQ
jgi:hypothetical protein